MNEDCRITDNGEKMETTHMSSNSVCAVVGENVMWKDVQDTLSEKKKAFMIITWFCFVKSYS